MNNKKRQQSDSLRPHTYIVKKKGNLIQIVNLIERTPNMVKVVNAKAA
jgi:hypothetical protein